MKNTRIIIAVVLAAVMLALTACAAKEAAGCNTEFVFTPADGDTTYTVAFSAALPKGWELRPVNDEAGFPRLGGVLFNVKYVYNERGECVGAVGANICTPENLGGDESAYEDPQAVYSQINMGSGFRVDTHEVYTPVACEESMRTALTKVFYSAYSLTGRGYESSADVTAPAVIAEELSTHCYVVMEIDDGVLTDAELASLAESIRLTAK